MALSPSSSILDKDGNPISSQVSGSQQALDIGINVAGIQVDPRDTRALTGADQITVAASALPSGASTSAEQVTGNASLASIDSKLTNPLPVSSTPAHGALTDRSGTVGSTSTSIVPANPTRKYLFIQNLSGSKLYINFTTAANQGQPSILLGANGGSIVFEGNFVTTEQVFAVASGASSPYTAKEA